MKNTSLYIITVLIWGSSWFAIEFQLGHVDIVVAVFYRFTLAAIIMWGYCLIRRIPMSFGRRDHFFLLVLALLNFSLNYLIVYHSQKYLTSAMTSIAFSTMLLMNILNTRIFFGKPIAGQIWVGAFCGIAGLIALFWRDLQNEQAGDQALLGLTLALLAAFLASLGNMANVRNLQQGMNVFAANAWGMLYGSALLLLAAVLTGATFKLVLVSSFIASLLYLGIFATVIAFASYYQLLKNIGPEKGSYVLILFPVVSVILSTLFEGFVWSQSSVIGFVMVLLGNAIILTPVQTLRAMMTARK